MAPYDYDTDTDSESQKDKQPEARREIETSKFSSMVSSGTDGPPDDDSTHRSVTNANQDFHARISYLKAKSHFSAEFLKELPLFKEYNATNHNKKGGPGALAPEIPFRVTAMDSLDLLDSVLTTSSNNSPAIDRMRSVVTMLSRYRARWDNFAINNREPDFVSRSQNLNRTLEVMTTVAMQLYAATELVDPRNWTALADEQEVSTLRQGATWILSENGIEKSAQSEEMLQSLVDRLRTTGGKDIRELVQSDRNRVVNQYRIASAARLGKEAKTAERAAVNTEEGLVNLGQDVLPSETTGFYVGVAWGLSQSAVALNMAAAELRTKQQEAMPPAETLTGRFAGLLGVMVTKDPERFRLRQQEAERKQQADERQKVLRGGRSTLENVAYRFTTTLNAGLNEDRNNNAIIKVKSEAQRREKEKKRREADERKKRHREMFPLPESRTERIHLFVNWMLRNDDWKKGFRKQYKASHQRVLKEERVRHEAGQARSAREIPSDESYAERFRRSLRIMHSADLKPVTTMGKASRKLIQRTGEETEKEATDAMFVLTQMSSLASKTFWQGAHGVTPDDAPDTGEQKAVSAALASVQVPLTTVAHHIGRDAARLKGAGKLFKKATSKLAKAKAKLEDKVQKEGLLPEHGEAQQVSDWLRQENASKLNTEQQKLSRLEAELTSANVTLEAARSNALFSVRDALERISDERLQAYMEKARSSLAYSQAYAGYESRFKAGAVQLQLSAQRLRVAAMSLESLAIPPLPPDYPAWSLALKAVINRATDVRLEIKQLSAKETGTYVNQFSKRGKLAGAIATWANEGENAYAAQYPNEDRSEIRRAMEDVLWSGGVEHFTSQNDPDALKFNARITESLYDVRNNRLMMPPSPTEILDNSKSINEWLHEWGQQQVISRSVYGVMLYGFGSVDRLLSMAIGISPSNIVRVIKLALAPIMMGWGLRRLSKATRPYEDYNKDVQMEYVLLETFKIAFKLVTGLLPGLIKTGLSTVFTATGLAREKEYRKKFFKKSFKLGLTEVPFSLGLLHVNMAYYSDSSTAAPMSLPVSMPDPGIDKAANMLTHAEKNIMFNPSHNAQTEQPEKSSGRQVREAPGNVTSNTWREGYYQQILNLWSMGYENFQNKIESEYGVNINNSFYRYTPEGRSRYISVRGFETLKKVYKSPGRVEWPPAYPAALRETLELYLEMTPEFINAHNNRYTKSRVRSEYMRENLSPLLIRKIIGMAEMTTEQFCDEIKRKLGVDIENQSFEVRTFTNGVYRRLKFRGYSALKRYSFSPGDAVVWPNDYSRVLTERLQMYLDITPEYITSKYEQLKGAGSTRADREKSYLKKVIRRSELTPEQYEEGLRSSSDTDLRDAEIKIHARSDTNGKMNVYTVKDFKTLAENYDPLTHVIEWPHYISYQLREELEDYLNQTPQDVAAARLMLAHHEQIEFYETAYPTELRPKFIIDSVIQKEINKAMGLGSGITPDTKVYIYSYEIGKLVCDFLDRGPLKPLIKSIVIDGDVYAGGHTVTLRDLATGKFDREHKGAISMITFRNGLEKIFRSSAGGELTYPYGITSKIEAEFEKSVEKMETNASKKARQELIKQGINNRLAMSLFRESESTDIYKAIDKILKGEVSPSIVKFQGYELDGVFAIPTGDKDKYFIFDVYGQVKAGSKPYLIMDFNYPKNADDFVMADRVSEMLRKKVPHKAKDIFGYSEGKENEEAYKMKWGIWDMTRDLMNLSEPEYFRKQPVDQQYFRSNNPYTLKEVSFGKNGDSLAKKMHDVQMFNVKENLDSVLYNTNEYYMDMATTIIQYSLEALGGGTMALQGRILKAAVGLVLSAIGAGADFADASMEENPDAQRTKWIAGVLGLLLSSYGDVVDARTLTRNMGQAINDANLLRDYVSVLPTLHGPKDVDMPHLRGTDPTDRRVASTSGQRGESAADISKDVTKADASPLTSPITPEMSGQRKHAHPDDHMFDTGTTVDLSEGKRFILQIGSSGGEKWKQFETYAKSSMAKHHIPEENVFGELNDLRGSTLLQKPLANTLSSLTLNDRLDLPVHGSSNGPSDVGVGISAKQLAKKLSGYGLKKVGVIRLDSCNVGDGFYLVELKKALHAEGIEFGYLSAPNGYLQIPHLPFLNIRPVWQMRFWDPWHTVKGNADVNFAHSKYQSDAITARETGVSRATGVSGIAPPGTLSDDAKFDFNTMNDWEKIYYLSSLAHKMDEARQLAVRDGKFKPWRLIRKALVHRHEPGGEGISQWGTLDEELALIKKILQQELNAASKGSSIVVTKGKVKPEVPIWQKRLGMNQDESLRVLQERIVTEDVRASGKNSKEYKFPPYEDEYDSLAEYLDAEKAYADAHKRFKDKDDINVLLDRPIYDSQKYTTYESYEDDLRKWRAAAEVYEEVDTVDYGISNDLKTSLIADGAYHITDNDIGVVDSGNIRITHGFDEGGDPAQSDVNHLVVSAHGVYDSSDTETSFIPRGTTVQYAAPYGMSALTPDIRNAAKRYDSIYPHSVVSTDYQGGYRFNVIKAKNPSGDTKHTMQEGPFNALGLESVNINEKGVEVAKHRLMHFEDTPLLETVQALTENRMNFNVGTPGATKFDLATIKKGSGAISSDDFFKDLKVINDLRRTPYTVVNFLACRNVEFENNSDRIKFLAKNFRMSESDVNKIASEDNLNMLEGYRTYDDNKELPGVNTGIRDEVSQRIKRALSDPKCSLRIVTSQFMDMKTGELGPEIVLGFEVNGEYISAKTEPGELITMSMDSEPI